MSESATAQLEHESDTPEAVAEFVERLGLIIEAEGLPRIAGRILGLLIVYGGPFSFSEVAERLKISRGSVSTNTRLLEDMGMIVRTTRPGERQDFFKLAPDPYRQFLTRLAERSRRAQAMVETASHGLPPDWREARERMAGLSEFYRRMREMSEAVAADLSGRG